MTGEVTFGNFIKENNAHPVINQITAKAEEQKAQEQAMMQQQPGGGLVSQDDPFALAQYQQMGGNDVPIKMGGGMADAMISNDDVPPNFLEKYWFVFNKDNVLTFLDEKRKDSKLLNLDIIKIDHLNMTP